MRVLIFSANWCSSCIIMRSIWNKISNQYPNLIIENYDYDIDINEVKKWDIGDILPVSIFIQNGKEIDRFIGEKSYQEIETFINKFSKEAVI